MRAVIQRVSSASVRVDGRIVGKIDLGLAVLVGVHRDDEESDATKLADRLVGMRIFEDPEGKLNLSLQQVGGSVLLISNFTLYGDASQRRPSFVQSANFERGQALFERLIQEMRALDCDVYPGEFGADMKVELVNDGPVTLIVDTR